MIKHFAINTLGFEELVPRIIVQSSQVKKKMSIGFNVCNFIYFISRIGYRVGGTDLGMMTR